MPFTLTLAEPLLRLEFGGTLTGADLAALSRALAEIEDADGRFTRRLSVLTAITRVEVGFPEVSALARRRVAATLPGPVRSAMVAATPVQVGMARMFQTLNDHPRITIQIFPDVPGALEWLGATDLPS
jgi:hypothetical protein